MPELSILIPARNEQYLQRTIEDILEHAEGDTEVIVGFDGGIKNFPVFFGWGRKFRWLDSPFSIGQRAMTNELARLSNAKYVMKTDAHCSFSQGFDVEMMEDMDGDTLMVPVLLNLRPYRWLCGAGHIQDHQNKQPARCGQCESPVMHQEEIWETIPKPVTSSFYFDTKLIFQYSKDQPTANISETMAIQGSGWMVSRDQYWRLNLSDEKFGSWGQQGVEVACKTWLSGGRVLNTKNAYMGHWFRKEDEFPYERDMKQVEGAYQRSKELFLENKWPKQKYPLSWLVEKFNYPGDWGEESGKEVTERVKQLGQVFNRVV